MTHAPAINGCPYLLDVSVSGNGTVTPGTSTYPYPAKNPAAMVDLTATAASGYAFLGWSGRPAGLDSTRTMTVKMDQDHSLTAHFKPRNSVTAPIYDLRLVLGTGGGGTVKGVGQGTLKLVTTPDNSGTYNRGERVALTATPSQGYTFMAWTGCTATVIAPAACTVTMNADKSVTASFTPQCTLEVDVDPAEASTSSASTTGNCGSSLTVNAPLAATGYDFTGWSSPCSGKGSCTVAVGTSTGTPQTQSVTANYAPRYCTVSVKVGTGSGSVSTTPIGGRVQCGVGEVKYEATAGKGYCFSIWHPTLGASGQQASCEASGEGKITPTTDFTFTATFTHKQCTLNVFASPAAGGTVTGGWTGNCGTRLSASTAPTATAATMPVPGYYFTGWTSSPVGWTGGCSGTGTCTPTVGTAAGAPGTFSLTAGFKPWCRLQGQAGDGGSVGTVTGACGTTLRITATPNVGKHVSKWSGVCAEAPTTTTTVAATCGVTVGASADTVPTRQTVAVTFAQNQCVLRTGVGSGGGGSVGAGGTGDCGRRVTIVATPVATHNFSHWTGACATTSSATCAVRVGSPTGNPTPVSATAHFTRKPLARCHLKSRVSASAGAGGASRRPRPAGCAETRSASRRLRTRARISRAGPAIAAERR